MGAQNRYINITGCNSLESVNKAVDLFKRVSKVSLIQNLKINSISFKLRVSIDELRLSHLKATHCDIFGIKTFPRFTGICFKHKKLRIAGNFFRQSEKIVCMGAKSVNEIFEYTKDLIKIGFIVIN